MQTIRYNILQNEHGQAIQCGRCHLISYHPDDVSNRYCTFCKLFLNDQEGPFAPLTLAEFQTIYNRLYRFITSEQAMRKIVFPPGNPKRMEKLTATDQALNDLQLIKDVIKQQFLLFGVDLNDPTQTPTQPKLLDVPVKSNYQ